MKPFNRVLLRSPLALGLGATVFAVGLYRLVVLSTVVTIRVMLGETPDRAIAYLGAHGRR